MTTSNRTGTFNKSLLSFVALLTFAGATFAETTTVASEQVIVFLVDDQTGEELATKHGIQPLAVGDIEVLINAVIRGRTPVRLCHDAVDEDSTDNAVAELNFRPFAGGQPPKAPSPGLPLSRLADAMKAYRKDRAEWQRGIIDYRKQMIAEIERFIKGVTITQLSVSERFDQMLAARNGRDFNRSDILSCITTANSMLGEKGQRFLVLNTDCEDLPAKRAPRKTALLAKELDPEIELIFVNTSGLPDHSVLFRGIKNPVHHADSMKAAMELIAASLSNEPGAETASVTDKPQSVTPSR